MSVSYRLIQNSYSHYLPLNKNIPLNLKINNLYQFFKISRKQSIRSTNVTISVRTIKLLMLFTSLKFSMLEDDSVH